MALALVFGDRLGLIGVEVLYAAEVPVEHGVFNYVALVILHLYVNQRLLALAHGGGVGRHLAVYIDYQRAFNAERSAYAAVGVVHVKVFGKLVGKAFILIALNVANVCVGEGDVIFVAHYKRNEAL